MYYSPIKAHGFEFQGARGVFSVVAEEAQKMAEKRSAQTTRAALAALGRLVSARVMPSRGFCARRDVQRQKQN